MQSASIEVLIQLMSKLPALGPRSSRRAVLHLLKKKETLMEPLISALTEVSETIKTCSVCGNLDTDEICHICSDVGRIHHQLCVVQDVSDLWALERANVYQGMYHVLGGVLSALDGIGPDELQISSLVSRIKKGEIREVILALPATVDGQMTAHYLTDILEKTGVTISGLSHGVPVGGELDYLDEGTLQTAFRTRRLVKE
ncbi:MAG: recombination protein RecR [Alphaproteobacteria bacterium]|nr:recombination protein RecR [Alphaproteobacteria bacterium]